MYQESPEDETFVKYMCTWDFFLFLILHKAEDEDIYEI